MAKLKTKVKSKTKVVAVSKSASKRSDLVRRYLKEAKAAVETGYVKMCKLTNEAYKKEYYKSWKFNSFEDYCKIELDMEYRKAMFFVHIADKMEELSIPDARAEIVGWSKLKEIIKVATPKNLEKWLTKAEKSNLLEIEEAVRITKRKDSGDKDVPHTTTMKFKMGEDVAGIVTDALSEAKTLLDTEDTIQALQMICMDWLENKGKIPQRTSKEDMIKFIDDIYGEGKKPENTSKASKKSSSNSKKEAVKSTGKVSGKKSAKKSGPDKSSKSSKAGSTDEQDIEEMLDLG